MMKINNGKIMVKQIIANAPDKSPYSIYYRNALAHAYMEWANDPIACRNTLEAADWQVDLGIWNSEAMFNNTCREWLERRFKAYNADIDEYERTNSPLRFLRFGD